jgi:hypothetical protein
MVSTPFDYSFHYSMKNLRAEIHPIGFYIKFVFLFAATNQHSAPEQQIALHQKEQEHFTYGGTNR